MGLDGSALSKIKISFERTDLLYLDPRGGLELPEAKVVVYGGRSSNREKLTFPSRKFRRTDVRFPFPLPISLLHFVRIYSLASSSEFERRAFEFMTAPSIDVSLLIPQIRQQIHSPLPLNLTNLHHRAIITVHYIL